MSFAHLLLAGAREVDGETATGTAVAAAAALVEEWSGEGEAERLRPPRPRTPPESGTDRVAGGLIRSLASN